MNRTKNYQEIGAILFKKAETEAEAAACIAEAKASVFDSIMRGMNISSYQVHLISEDDIKVALEKAKELVNKSDAFTVIMEATDLRPQLTEIGFDEANMDYNPSDRCVLVIAREDPAKPEDAEDVWLDWEYTVGEDGVISFGDAVEIGGVITEMIGTYVFPESEEDMKMVLGKSPDEYILDVIELFQCAADAPNTDMVNYLLPLLPKEEDVDEDEWDFLQEAKDTYFTQGLPFVTVAGTPEERKIAAQIIKKYWDTDITNLSIETMYIASESFYQAVEDELVGTYQENYEFLTHMYASLLKVAQAGKPDNTMLTCIYVSMAALEHQMLMDEEDDKVIDLVKFVERAESRRNSDHAQKQIKYLIEANKYMPNDYKILYLLAGAYNITGDLKEAKKAIKACLEVLDCCGPNEFSDITFVQGHLLAGNIYFALGKPKKGKKHIKKAREMMRILKREAKESGHSKEQEAQEAAEEIKRFMKWVAGKPNDC